MKFYQADTKCPTCKGFRQVPEDDSHDPRYNRCPTCDGTGMKVVEIEPGLVVHWREDGGVDSTHFGSHENCGGEQLYRMVEKS